MKRSTQIAARIDFPLLIAVIVTVAFGIIMIGSAGGREISLSHLSLGPIMRKQLLGLIIGLVFMLIITFLSKELLNFATVPAYIFMILLLVAVLAIGVGSGTEGEEGVRRWIPFFGGYTLQPSEFAKFFLVLVLARFCEARSERINYFPNLLLYMLLVGVPLFLILKEPDLSTTIVVFSIAAVILFASGLDWKYIVLALVIGGAAIYIIYSDAYNPSGPRILSEYQATRIWAFFEPEKYAQNYAYQTLKSQYAISSGGLTGVGLSNSSGMIPVPMTDFIFGILGEELGFFGCSVYFLLLAFIVWRILYIGMHAKDLYGKLVCAGVGTWIALQSAIHIGVNTAILPNTGIPLPFMSYGMSSLLSSLIGIGMVLQVHASTKRQDLLLQVSDRDTVRFSL